MKKLNICVDIDGTLTEPFYWMKKANEYFNTNLEPKDATKYEIHDLLGISEEQFVEFYLKHGEYLHSSANIRENVKETLDKLNEFTNIYYVTARDEKMKKITELWLKNYDLPLNKVFLLGSHNKVKKAIELECDIFIEDRYENAMELAAEGFKVILIDCKYNRKPLIDGITRVNNWNEIYSIIKNYHDEVNKNIEIVSA